MERAIYTKYNIHRDRKSHMHTQTYVQSLPSLYTQEYCMHVMASFKDAEKTSILFGSSSSWQPFSFIILLTSSRLMNCMLMNIFTILFLDIYDI